MVLKCAIANSFRMSLRISRGSFATVVFRRCTIMKPLRNSYVVSPSASAFSSKVECVWSLCGLASFVRNKEYAVSPRLFRASSPRGPTVAAKSRVHSIWSHCSAMCNCESSVPVVVIEASCGCRRRSNFSERHRPMNNIGEQWSVASSFVVTVEICHWQDAENNVKDLVTFGQSAATLGKFHLPFRNTCQKRFHDV
jgi:hypothetical protein